MHIGVSSYSFARSIAAGRTDLVGTIDTVAGLGASHLEIALAGAGTDLIDSPELVALLRERSRTVGLDLANYVVGADLSGDDAAAENEVARLAAHVDVAAALGIPTIRHDVLPWAWREQNHAEFESALSRIVPRVRQVCDIAADRGITTTVENHGMSLNDPERLIRLIELVDRPTFRATLDVGNFLCVAADPVLAVRRLLPYAAVVHLKDFRVRRTPPGDGWLRTLNDSAILGTIVGWGDLPLRTIASDITASGFDGPISIEFEGPEDDGFAVAEGLRQARALFDEEAA